MKCRPKNLGPDVVMRYPTKVPVTSAEPCVHGRIPSHSSFEKIGVGGVGASSVVSQLYAAATSSINRSVESRHIIGVDIG